MRQLVSGCFEMRPSEAKQRNVLSIGDTVEQIWLHFIYIVIIKKMHWYVFVYVCVLILYVEEFFLSVSSNMFR